MSLTVALIPFSLWKGKKYENTLVSLSILNDLGLDTLHFISSKISKSSGILSRLRNTVYCLTYIDLLFKFTCPMGLQSAAKLPDRIWKTCWFCKNVLSAWYLSNPLNFTLYLLSTCQTYFLVIWSILRQSFLLCMILSTM